MSMEIRTLQGNQEVNSAFKVFLHSMVGLPVARDTDTTGLVEDGRYLGALDGDTVVGGADSYTSWLTVPGGERVSHAAVTHVGVLPTHTRQGIVTSLITGQLRDFAERGEVVASLRASEAVIYERFGYGVASSATSARVTLGRARLRTTAATSGQVRLAHNDEDRWGLVPDIYARAAWTGSIKRPDGWWLQRRQMSAADPTQSYLVIHSTDGVDDGYAVYQPRDTQAWFTSPQRVVAVSDFVTHSEAAHLGLLRHLLSLDLVDVVELDSLALDDPLPTLFTDQRAVQLGAPHDETWLRIIDVEVALNARTYREAEPVVIEVTDRWLPQNEGRFEVSAKGASRTTAEPDLGADVSSLGAAYLGGTRWWQLARSGRADERVKGALVRADELFATAELPFAGTTF